MDKNNLSKSKYQDLSKFKQPAGFRGRSAITVQLWWIVQGTFFALSPQFMYRWRNFLLRLFGASIGKNVLIRPKARITYPWKLTMGDNIWIGDESVIYNLADVVIGNNVSIAHRVYLCTGLHDYSKLGFDISAKSILISDEVWLPNDIFVGPGVKIGRGVVVGARSSVFSDLPEGMICYGTPAIPIKQRIVTSL